MQEALTHPVFGYYPAGIRGIGGVRGDFATWPGMENSLARAVRRWLRTGPGRVIETGAGDGSLAAGILSGIWRRPKFGIVEMSPVLRRLQHQRLGRRATWFESPAEALKAWDGSADLIANELVDAFPVRVFRKEGGAGWSEMHVTIDSGRAVMRWLPAIPPPLPVFDLNWRKGQILEVLSGFDNWLAGWIGHWKEGRLLLIDYGDTCPKLQRLHPAGTLRAYARHQRLTGPEILEGFGRRDITADVDFSAVEKILRSAGLHIPGHTTLTAFLEKWCRRPVPPAFQPAAEAFRIIEAVPSAG